MRFYTTTSFDFEPYWLVDLIPTKRHKKVRTSILFAGDFKDLMIAFEEKFPEGTLVEARYMDNYNTVSKMRKYGRESIPYFTVK